MAEDDIRRRRHRRAAPAATSPRSAPRSSASTTACIDDWKNDKGEPGARRHLHQRRLHPVEGAAAVVGELRARRPRTSPTTASRSSGLTLDVAKMLARKDKVVEAEQRRHRVPVQEEQGHVLPRPRRVRRRPATAATRSRSPARAERRSTAKHVIVATGSNAARAAGRAVRRRAHPVDNDGALRIRRSAEDASASSAPA